MFACNGILFNHESPRRGETFVTRKITRGISNLAFGLENCLYLGNLDALRDWGHAKDYVYMQWMMLQQEIPEDFVIATGQQFSVREFVEWSASEIGVSIEFSGEGVNEVGVVSSIEGNKAPSLSVGDEIIKVDPGILGQLKLKPCLEIQAMQRKNLVGSQKFQQESYVQK